MVAGLTNGELIAPMTYEETMTSDFFEVWFQKFLLPTLTTPSVIIMDNSLGDCISPTPRNGEELERPVDVFSPVPLNKRELVGSGGRF
ncbi:Mobile element protein [Streptococcus pneumoniae]|nr:Mobile element protein [Streptococcus pneumoniae]